MWYVDLSLTECTDRAHYGKLYLMRRRGTTALDESCEGTIELTTSQSLVEKSRESITGHTKRRMRTKSHAVVLRYAVSLSLSSIASSLYPLDDKHEKANECLTLPKL